MRTDEWLSEFSFDMENLDESTKENVLKGSIEICLCCRELSAYAWQDTTSYDDLGDIIPGGFKPAPDTIAHISSCSGLGEWQCGHCGKHLVEANSPLLAPCWTHSED